MPRELAIVNTSPLLYLHQIDFLNLLPSLYEQVWVPEAVVHELEAGKAQGINVPDVRSIAWVSIQEVAAIAVFPTVIDLGPGEAEVIALGLQNPGATLILDDRLARQIAKLYQQSLTGTLGLLIKAKQMGVLQELAPKIAALQSAGMWLSDAVVIEALRLAGETEER